MPNVTFFLKEPKGKTPTLIYLFYRFNNNTFKYSTGQKINPKFWNPEKKRAKETRSNPGYNTFNDYLNDLQTKIQSAVRTAKIEGRAITPDSLRMILNTLTAKDLGIEKSDFIAFLGNAIESSNKKLGTLKHHRQTLRRLQEFTMKSKGKLGFDDVNLEFYQSFVRYCIEKGYGTNTIGGYIKNIKTYMGEAVDRKLTSNLEFRSRKFKKLTEESDSIYLTLEEVEKINYLDLSGNPRLDRVRDLFIVGCYTGLRFSDLVQVNERNLLDNNSKLRLKTVKTGGTVVIPLNSKVRAIVEKYNSSLPTDISNQKMNDYLKEIGELSGIASKVQLSYTKGGIMEKTTYKKFELITVHTARRSFATNAYLKEIPSISIMKITGHRTEKAFMTYIKMSQDDNANKLLTHPFFT